MDAHGYILKGNSKTASTDFLPSMVGLDTVNPNSPSPYFERIDITDRSISSIEITRWIDDTSHSPILGVRSRGVSYYIPLDELYEIAAFNHDDDTVEMLDELKKGIRA